MIVDDEPDESWAPELLDFEVTIAACYLEAQLASIARGEAPLVVPAGAPGIGPEGALDDLERLLSYGKAPDRPLHPTRLPSRPGEDTSGSAAGPCPGEIMRPGFATSRWR